MGLGNPCRRLVCHILVLTFGWFIVEHLSSSLDHSVDNGLVTTNRSLPLPLGKVTRVSFIT